MAEPGKKPTLTKIERAKINDQWIRLIGIPGFGISIPNFTGLFGDLTYHQWQYWFGYLYFILIAFLVWEGNRWLLLKQREYNNWFSNPIRKLVVLVASNVVYSAPLAIGMLVMWYSISGLVEIDWQAIRVATLAVVICVIFVTHVYETVFLIKERQEDFAAVEKLERAKAEAQLEALKNQIDPHFMFNSLNTLSYLIENEPDKAILFNEKLADIYRYILMHKNDELITLKEEIEFANNYFTLLQLRFGEGVTFDYQVKEDYHNYLVPPVSLQILLENAVKHNQFDENYPLLINLQFLKERLLFSNNLRKKTLNRPSSKLGLKNLGERYELITGQKIKAEEKAGQFVVEVPLLKVNL